MITFEYVEQFSFQIFSISVSFSMATAVVGLSSSLTWCPTYIVLVPTPPFSSLTWPSKLALINLHSCLKTGDSCPLPTGKVTQILCVTFVLDPTTNPVDGGWWILPFQLGPVVFLLPRTFSTVTQDNIWLSKGFLLLTWLWERDENGEDLNIICNGEQMKDRKPEGLSPCWWSQTSGP